MFGIFRQPHESEAADVPNLRMLRLAQLMGELIALDPELKLFGADWGHRYQLKPVLPLQELQSFEREYAVKLPQDYADFLTLIGNGGMGPGYGLLSLQEAAPDPCRASLATPFPYTTTYSIPEDDAAVNDSAADDSAWENFTLCGTIQLAEYGCGNQARLVISGPQAGQVWSYDSAVNISIGPTGEDFFRWYEWWLRDSIAKMER